MNLTNPLPPLWDAFCASNDALEIVRKLAVKKESKKYTDLIASHCFSQISAYRHDILDNTVFPGLSDVSGTLKSAKVENDDLFIVGLWANFERFLRDYLDEKGSVLSTQVEPSDLGSALYCHYCKEVEYWKPDEILDFLKESVFKVKEYRKLIDQAKSLYKHRNWVAHGKRSAVSTKSGAFAPDYAYKILDEIIEILLAN